MSHVAQWIENKPVKLPVKDRIARILAFLAGSDDPTRDRIAGKAVNANPFGVPDWYPPGMDPDCSVQVAGTGLHVSRDGTTKRHNGFGPYDVPPPRDPVQFNLLRLARHKTLLRIYESAIAALDAQERTRLNPSIILASAFQWDVRHCGPAPLDSHGKLMPDAALTKLCHLRDYHGDMSYAIRKYLADHLGVDADRTTVG